MIKNILPDKAANLKASKNIRNCSKAFLTNVLIVGEDLLRRLYKLLYLRFYDSSDQRKSTM